MLSLLVPFFGLILLTATFLLLRLRSILRRSKPAVRSRDSRPTHLLIVLGSGGHTAEMIAMLTRATSDPNQTLRLSWEDFTHRTWVVSSGDSISAVRAKEFEEAKSGKSYTISTVPRAREIHQSLLSAPISCLKCLWACVGILTQNGCPDIVLCNGPATATILVFTSVLLRLCNWKGCETQGRMRTVYVESWARVKRLSLSGKLLERVVDRFLVQWPQLEGGKREFGGVLV
jgi:beta-1,4-N-acetylglucosaminyltransferase